MKLITFMMMITQVISIPLNERPVPDPLPIDYLLQGLAVHNPPLVGSPYDDKGCCISCGYTYCDTLLECIRPWETDCPKLINPFLPQDNNIH